MNFESNYVFFYKSPKDFSDILLTSDGEYLTGLKFINSQDDLKQSRNYIEKELPVFKETFKWLDIYFSGVNPNFIPKFKLNDLTSFQNDVISELLKIKYGEITTYSNIATTLAKKYDIEKMSAQAVGGAVGSNPICIIIPCHRVVGKNNKLVGYGGGINNKIELLKLEGIDVSNYAKPSKAK